ncbi:MAG: SGNH/GDSL hydrolase family protein [Candidatus Sabulitectum sp.]|nr:SGNH/GDSL hydrolase family protein [Candidatus Sabulitectum sp.]
MIERGRSRKGRTFFYSGFLLLLAAATLFLLVLAESDSTNPVILDRFSIPLASAMLLFILIVLSGLYALLFKTGSTLSISARMVSSLGRIPAFLELSIMFGWVPILFMLLAGKGLFPLLGEARFLFGLALAYIGYLIITTTLISLSRRKLLLERILLLGISTFVGLLAVEVFVRILSPSSVFSASLEFIPHQNLTINVDLPGMSPIITHTTNSMGFRGEEPPADWDSWLTIVTLGGSTTHCYYIDDLKTWPHLLQENLRGIQSETWVGNAGFCGHSTRAHIILMQEVILNVMPDMVVLLVGTNDVVYSTRVDPEGEGVGTEKSTLGYKFVASSRLLQLLNTWLKGSFGEVHILTENLPPYIHIPLDGPEMELPDDIRDLCTSLDEYNRNIREIIRLGRESGTRIIFMTQPALWEDSDYWRGIQESYYWDVTEDCKLSAATVWRMLDIFNFELISICSSEGILCLDLASVVPHSPEYFYDGMHLNEAGAQLVSNLLADFMIEQNLVEYLPVTPAGTANGYCP